MSVQNLTAKLNILRHTTDYTTEHTNLGNTEIRTPSTRTNYVKTGKRLLFNFIMKFVTGSASYECQESGASIYYRKSKSMNITQLTDLALQLVMVLPDTLWTGPDRLMDLSSPVNLVDTDGNLPWPLSHPLDVGIHGICLGTTSNIKLTHTISLYIVM